MTNLTHENLKKIFETLHDNHKLIVLPRKLFEYIHILERETTDLTRPINLSNEKHLNKWKLRIYEFYLYLLKHAGEKISVSQAFVTTFTTRPHYNKAFLKLFKQANLILLVHGHFVNYNAKSSPTVYRVKKEHILFDNLIVDTTSTNKKPPIMRCNITNTTLRGLYGAKYKTVLDTLKNAKLTDKRIIEIIINRNHLEDDYNRIIKALNFNKNRSITKNQSSDRVYTTMCSLAEFFRNEITINGNKFHSIDLRSAQPTLLVKLILQRINDRQVLNTEKLTNELKDYIEKINNGEFYEQFKPINDSVYTQEVYYNEKTKKWITKNNIKIPVEFNDENSRYYWRDVVKKELFKTVYSKFRSKNGYELNELFRLKYPEISKVLIPIKDDIASLLHQAEANIFNNIIKEVELKSKYFFSVYDSIYFTDENDVGVVGEYIKDKLKYAGIEAKLNVKINK